MAIAAAALALLPGCEVLKRLPLPTASVGITGVTPSGDTWFAGLSWPPPPAQKSPVPILVQPQK